MRYQRRLFVGRRCVLCPDREFSVHGMANHGLMHVRRNEAWAEVSPRFSSIGGPTRYEFYVGRRP